MKKQYQVTLIAQNGRYKPASTIVTVEETADRKTIMSAGVTKICQKRYWGKSDLVRYTYTKAKIREYDPVKIQKENEERYERIKEEKYASGEWKRPKEDNVEKA